MASFTTAYEKYIKPNEGGYVNHPADKGGETYAGIARNFHPTWEGWRLVDMKKSRYAGGIIPRDAKFDDIQFLVDKFYLNLWDKNKFGQINSQEVANLLFDYYINSGTIGIKAIQRLVGVTADGAMGPITINAINNANAAKLHNALKAERGAFYESLIQKNPSQEVFRAGWFNRLARFPDLTAPGLGIIAIIIAAGIALYLYAGSPEPQKKKLDSLVESVG